MGRPDVSRLPFAYWTEFANPAVTAIGLQQHEALSVA